MTTRRPNTPSLHLNDPLSVKRRKAAPYEFVLEALATASPHTRSMFGCLAVYLEDKIVLVLRDRPNAAADNGVWLATAEEHHQSLRRIFPNMRSIQVFRKEVTAWQVLPVDAPDFEESALAACELIAAKDLRIGKVPGARRAPASKRAKAPTPPTPPSSPSPPARRGARDRPAAAPSRRRRAPKPETP
jgi:hypothetical protein